MAVMLIAFVCLSLLAVGKQTEGPIISPEVHPDRTVTFRFKYPAGAEIKVEVESKAALPMTKDANGVWSATTPPMEPGYYGYSFSADGLSFVDPANPLKKPNLLWQSSMFLVPGDPPRLWEVQQVPHGVVHQHFYRSEIVGDQRDYYVYTPPGYEPSSAHKYPVLYLLHGYSDTANAWTSVGMASVIMDNLIAQGRVKPMIVVMPLGYGVSGFASPGSKAFDDRTLNKRNFDNFRSTLIREIIPRIESEYRVSTSRKDKALAGLSMGGAETLYAGLNNLDTFGYLGAFSAGGLPVTWINEAIDAKDLNQCFPGIDAATVNRSLELLYISCGTEDWLIGFHRGFVAWLKGQKIKCKDVETPGSHVWMPWRQNLIEFSELIFK